MWPKLLTDLVFLRSKTQSFSLEKHRFQYPHGMRGGGEGGSGKSPDPSHPLPESVTEDFMTKTVKRRFHFS